MAASVFFVLLFLSVSATLEPSARTEPDSLARGRAELRRVLSLTSQPRYGECWARALEHLDTRCREMTSESQSRVALRFTRCHLRSSGRDFPSCPEESEVRRCTAGMDAVAFHTYTEFFTHAHSMCHFLQAEAWQNRAETTMHRLTESSAGVADQLQSTRQMAEDLIEAQSATLQAQQAILNNGDELRETLRDSTQGLRSIFSELSSVSREQQVALSELFSRVSFLQRFLVLEAHSLSSCLYNAAALCASFLLTATQRSSRARLVLLVLVCLNFYLERKIHQFVLSSDRPEHKHTELVGVYVSVLRRFMECVAVCVLLCVCLRYKDPVQQSLEILEQLRETQRSLQEALQHAECLGRQEDKPETCLDLKRRTEGRRKEETLQRRRKEEVMGGAEEPHSMLHPVSMVATISHSGWSDSFLSSTVCGPEGRDASACGPDASACGPEGRDASACGPDASACGPEGPDASACGPEGPDASACGPEGPDASACGPEGPDASACGPGTCRPAVSHARRPRRFSSSRLNTSSSPLINNILVDRKQPRYSLRSRRSETT